MNREAVPEIVQARDLSSALTVPKTPAILRSASNAA